MENSSTPMEPQASTSSGAKNTDVPSAAQAHSEASSGRDRGPKNNFRGSQGQEKNRRGGQKGDQRGGQRRDREWGRASWSRDTENLANRRGRNEETKRRRIDKGDGSLPVYATEFSKEEIEGESRKPKKKVAVLIGYCGSGYKGLQLSDKEKTIEGDIFRAFVAAGAISKANADDPKKTSLVRCARTDKGVHAAGNVLSLKLIVEDEDIVQKINEHLPAQIRVWGIVRTNGSFSCYNLCDSRIYEYLIPTHCFLPPHPKSYIGRKLDELAAQSDDLEGYKSRQEEVSSFWDEAEEQQIKPLLETMDPALREEALHIIFEAGSQELKEEANKRKRDEKAATNDTSTEGEDPSQPAQDAEPAERIYTPLETAVKDLKTAYATARSKYRLSPQRLARIQSLLQQYVGTHSYHNHTIQKSYGDPSAKRVMFSFKTAPEPIIIGDTEWLSMKVHGQSFMMHQIRKMVAMMTLVVRSGAPESRLRESFGKDRFLVPKAPGLGLLLERPIFGSYNKNIRHLGGVERGEVAFEKYEKEMDEFKQREIYERMFREEQEKGLFHGFTASLDNLRSSQLLYLSSAGFEATKKEGKEREEELEDVEAVLGEGEEKVDNVDS